MLLINQLVGFGVGLISTAPFPTVEGTPTNGSDHDGDGTVTVTLPTDIVSGELLFILIGNNVASGAPTISTPSGWTQLFTSTFSTQTLAGFIRTATGGDSNPTFNVGGSGPVCDWNARRIGNWQGTPEAAATGSGLGQPDPPSLTPSWGSANNLWFAAAASPNTSADATAPTNYTNIQQAQSNTIAQHECASAQRELIAASDDPGAFANFNGSLWVAATIAIRGL